MSVLTLATPTMDKLFNEGIKPGLEKAYITNTRVYGRFKTKEETCLGKYGVAKVITRGARSFRPSSTAHFPDAQQGAYDEFRFNMKRGMYGSLHFDGLALACGKGAGAVKDIVKTEVESGIDYASDKLNKQFWGDGSGRLAQLSAAISNTTDGYVDGPLFGQDSNEYTRPSTYLAEGMYVDIYSTAGVLEASKIRIVSITEGVANTDKIVFDQNITCSNDSYIFDHDTYAATEAAGTGVPMGLMGIISDANPYVGTTATSAFQNVNRANNQWAQAQVFSMGGQPLNNKSLIRAIQKVERWGTVSVILTNDIIWRNYYEMLEGDKTMPNPTEGFWGGTSGIWFYAGKKTKIPIIYDYDCPDNTVLFIDDSKIVISAPVKNGMDWLPGETGHILRLVSGDDTWAANLRWYYNMTCTSPRALGKLTNVKHLSY